MKPGFLGGGPKAARARPLRGQVERAVAAQASPAGGGPGSGGGGGEASTGQAGPSESGGPRARPFVVATFPQPMGRALVATRRIQKGANAIGCPTSIDHLRVCFCQRPLSPT